MGSITPLLDTLLHQVLGRQLSLDAHARQSTGTAAVSAVIRDSAVDDAAHSSSDSAEGKSSNAEDSEFADSMSTAQSRQQSASASSPSVSSSVRAAPQASADPHAPSHGLSATTSAAASAQLALSDTARALSEQVHLAAQQALLDDISSDILSDAPLQKLPALTLLSSLDDADSASRQVFTPVNAQPSMLLPLEEPEHFQVSPASRLPLTNDSETADPAFVSSDSASLEVSRTGRQMSQWTAALSGQDWQTLLSSESVTPVPLRFLSSAMILDTLGQDAPAAEQRDTLSHYLSAALKTSGLFHDALLMKWAGGHLPIETVEQSARQRQQLLSVLPAAPEFGDAVVRQQLQLMAGQPIHFQSELWAGAMMLMSFRTEPYVSEGADSSSAERRFPAFPDQRRVWTLTLTFELPTLGTVTAGLQWDGEAIAVTLDAEHQSTRKIMAAAQEALELLLNDGHAKQRAVDISKPLSNRGGASAE